MAARILRAVLTAVLGIGLLASTAEAQSTPPDADPPRPLQANPAWGHPGNASNLDGRTFEHYGVAQVALCDLPQEFIEGTEAYRVSWCRGYLSSALGVRDLPGTFTCHELLVTDADGQKFLAMYAVDAFDHSSSGRPLRYHPRHPDAVRDDPTTRRYIGGRGMLRRLEAVATRCFRPSYRRKSNPTPPPPNFTSAAGPQQQRAVDATGTCQNCLCANCGGCAEPAEAPNCDASDTADQCHPTCANDDANWCAP